jgi:hypothetical protein
MPDIEFTDNCVIIRIPKALLVLTKAQFIEALRQGKVYRRREQHMKRIAEHSFLDSNHKKH